MAWALATLGVVDAPAWSALAAAAEAAAPRMSPQGLSNTAWALARAGVADAGALEALAGAAYWSLNAFRPQELATTAWAFARLDHRAPTLFDAIAKRAAWRAEAFSGLDLANLAWAFGRARHRGGSGAMLAALSRAAARSLPAMSARQLASLAWGAAALGHADEALCAAIGRQAASPALLAAAEPRSVATLLWSLARLRRADRPFLLAAAAHLQAGGAGRLSAVDASTAAWAYAAAGCYSRPLFDVLGARCAATLEEATPQGLASALWAMAQARHRHAPLLAAAAARLVAPGELERQPPAVTAAAARAFALLGWRDGALMVRLAAHCGASLGRLPPAELPPLGLALALAGVRDAALYGALFAALGDAGAGALTWRGLRQLYRTQLLVCALFGLQPPRRGAAVPSPASSPANAPIPPESAALTLAAPLLREAFAAWRAYAPPAAAAEGDAVGRAASVQQLCTALAELGAAPSAAPDGSASGLPIDAAATHAGRRVAVLLDGPGAFLRSHPRALHPVAASDAPLLLVDGWEGVLRVAHWEWSALAAAGPAARRDFLADALATRVLWAKAGGEP
jgi:hypothetical protein